MTEYNALNQAISDAYDETPYTSNPFANTAPGHLRAVAHLFGLETAPLDGARVLELGCAAGGNLLPFAVAHPRAQVIGVDLSPDQVTAGQELANKLGVTNLDLRAMSITDIGASFGQFDYIVCHGVFSWVPPFVREAILRVCRENLAPDGIACISYNTYPGWKASDVVRDALQLNSFGAATAADRLKKAKDMLGLLEHGLAPSNPMRDALQQAVRTLRTYPDHYLLHEYLEEVNAPCYFLEFIATIQQAGLAYLCDAQPEGSFATNYGQATAALHASLSSGVSREMREQYLDFAVGRQFRQSLLVQANRAAQILERPEAAHFQSMNFSTQLINDTKRDDAEPLARHFLGPSNTGLTTQDPSLISLIEGLQEAWPTAIPYAKARELVTQNSSNTDADPDHQTLLHLISLFNVGALRYRRESVGYGNSSLKPCLIPGARALLQAAMEKPLQVGHYNLWHQLVTISSAPAARFVALLLDGSLTQAEVRTRLRDALTSGRVPHPDGLVLKGARNVDPVAQDLLNRIIQALRIGGVLL